MPNIPTKKYTPSSLENPLQVHFDLYIFQHTIVRHPARFKVAVVARQSGKSFMACHWLFAQVMQAPPHSAVAMVLPELKQARRVAWPIFKKILEPLTAASQVAFVETTLEIRLPGSRTIRLLGAAEPDSFRGQTLVAACIDEVADITSEFFETVFLATLSRSNGPALILGTPRGKNLLFDLYQKGLEGNNGNPEFDGWAAFIFNVFDAGVLSEDEIKFQRSAQQSHIFAQEFMCDFSVSNPDLLITLEEVEPAVNRELPFDPSQHPVTLGVDVARSGSDSSCIAVRQGPKLFPLHTFKGRDNMEMADTVARFIKNFRPKAVHVDAGAGAGVIDRLRQLGYGDLVIEVSFKATPMYPERSVNMRCEMYSNLKSWLETGSIPDDDTLIRELSTVLLKDDEGRRVKLAPKKEIKELLGHSPDRADAVALTCYGFHNTESEMDYEAMSWEELSQLPPDVMAKIPTSVIVQARNEQQTDHLEQLDNWIEGIMGSDDY